MTESNPNIPEDVPAMGDAPSHALPVALNIQYTKDLSFEVPNGPSIFSSLDDAPRVSVNIDVEANRLQENNHVYEVTLSIKVDAVEAEKKDQSPPRTVFIVELAYAAVVTLVDPTDDIIEPILLIEVPRLIFPFARNIICDTTRDGGFPPVVLQPIDFVALWQRKKGQQMAQTHTEAGHA